MAWSILTIGAVLSLAFTPTLAIPATRNGFSPNHQLFGLAKRQDLGAANSDDQFWIRKWAAIGDSYAAGIGAGERINWWCSRYDHSYPSIINSDIRMSGEQTFEYLACSGATSSKVVSSQVSSLSNGHDAITVSSGGNDVGLVDLLNQCVYTWNPNIGCAEQIHTSKQLIENELPGNLDNLYNSLKPKLSSSGSVYVTAYARFFDETTTECDNVSWHWFTWPIGVLMYQYLTQQRRKDLNELVDLVNGKIREAVQRAGQQFVLVEYDSYYGDFHGRYCMPGVQEPAPNRADLLFYLDGTKETANGQAAKNKRQVEGEPEDFEDPNSFPADSFEGQILSHIRQGQQKLIEDGADPNDPAFGSPPVPDSWARVFHPLKIGHSLIANKVMYHMSVVRANQLGIGAGPESVDESAHTCKAEASGIPDDMEASCGNNLPMNLPREFELLEGKGSISEILYRMRDQACQGLCEKINGVPDDLMAAKRQGENGCEYAAKISANNEIYFYATQSGENCYKATERMINTCMTDKNDGNPIKEAGSIDGPSPGESYKVGYRLLNGEGSNHDPITNFPPSHLGHVHVACSRSNKVIAHEYKIHISGWDDGDYGRSIMRAVKSCGLAMTKWKYEPGTDYVFPSDGTNEQHWSSFWLPLSNGGCAESKIEEAMGLRGGGLNCPFGETFELDMFKG